MPDFSSKSSFSAKIIRETGAAIFVYFEDLDESMWIPKSQIDDDSEIWKEGESGMITISEWIATKKGLL